MTDPPVDGELNSAQPTIKLPSCPAYRLAPVEHQPDCARLELLREHAPKMAVVAIVDIVRLAECVHEIGSSPN